MLHLKFTIKKSEWRETSLPIAVAQARDDGDLDLGDGK